MRVLVRTQKELRAGALPKYSQRDGVAMDASRSVRPGVSRETTRFDYDQRHVEKLVRQQEKKEQAAAKPAADPRYRQRIADLQRKSKEMMNAVDKMQRELFTREEMRLLEQHKREQRYDKRR